MGVFDNFPYTNNHELNLDWIIKQTKKVLKASDEIAANTEIAATAAENAAESASNAEAAKEAAETASTEITEAAAEIKNNKLNIIKALIQAPSKTQNKQELYTIPVDFDLPVYYDGLNFEVGFNKENYKNSGGTTYYFSPSGNNSNNGLSESTPKTDVRNGNITLADGDTLILLDGLYTRAFFPIEITKSINVIAKNPGKAIINNSDNTYSYTKVDNVYLTSRNNVKSVIIAYEGKYQPLHVVASLDMCRNIPFTYYNNGNDLYVNTGGVITPDNTNTFLNLGTGQPLTHIKSESGALNFYMDGVTCIGGYAGGIVATRTNYDLHFTAVNCNFIGAYTETGTAKDAVSLLGCKSILKNCIAAFSRKDGFNYHSSGVFTPEAIEINCEAFGNGWFGWDNSNNGSTIHDGGKILRVNGSYHGNYGSNVADVHNGTRSVNLGCNAYQSKATETDYNADFATQQAGAVMYLDNCKAYGSDWNLYAVTGTTIYKKDSLYMNTQGGGIITDY